MNVLVVTNAYPTEDNPVRGVFVQSQVRSLLQAGVRLEVELIRGHLRKSEYLRAIGRVRARVAKDSCVLCHAHYGLSGLIALAQSRVPVVVSFMGDDVYGTPDRHGRYGWLGRAIARASRWVARRADAVIVKSEALKAALGRPDAHVIPNGVDLDLFRPLPQDEARRRLGLDPSRRYVLFAGNPDLPVKDFDLARRTCDRLAGLEPAAELLVASHTPHEEMPWWYAAADALLLTSRHEGSPNSVKEAMACNLPVVSVGVGDVRQVVGNTAECLVVASRDPDELARALLGVVRPPRRSRGRENIAHLALDRVAAQVLAVYRAVLSRRERKAATP